MGQTDANGVDLSGVTGRLVQTVDLVKSPAPQAIATDTVNGHIFVLQVESSATAPQGNLYLNRIDRLTGTVTGSMQLKGFGHGLSMGAEPVGTDTYLWTEVGPLHTTSDGTTFGKAVTRFLFEPGKVLDGSLIPSERKFTPPGSTSGTGPSLDPVNRQLCVMYHKDGKRHFTRYDAAAAATGSWVPVGSTFVMPAGEDVTPDVPSPYPLKKTLVSQGFTVLGDVLYAYQWAPYDQENNPTTVPDAFPGIAFLTSYSWTTGQLLDLQVGQQGVEALVDLVLRQRLAVVLLQLEHGADVLFHRQLAEYRRLLRQVGQAQYGAAVDRQAGDVGAVDVDRAGIRRHQADDHVERRGLAGAVRAQQADHFTAFDLQRHVAHHQALAIAFLQALDDQGAAIAQLHRDRRH